MGPTFRDHAKDHCRTFTLDSSSPEALRPAGAHVGAGRATRIRNANAVVHISSAATSIEP